MSAAVPPTKSTNTLLGGVWREEARARIGRLRDELAQRKDPQAPPTTAHLLTQAGKDLHEAQDWVDQRADLAQWWSGSLIEACWTNLRRAEQTLFVLAPDAEMSTRAVDALSHGSWALGAEDARVTHLKSLLDKNATPAQLRAAGSLVLAASHEASDRQHRELRSFRNGLRVVILLLLALALVLLLAVALWKWPLLPASSEKSQVSLVALAMFFGALGALFSAVPSLAQVPEKVTTFSPVREQAALKVAVGAWSAIIGLMAVSAGLNSSATDTSSLAGFVMVAALFGAGQEAITRFADHKATDLRDASSKPAVP